ncbi:MAG: DUF4143 domain-containing protein [Kiritimatiellae bacterium]|nr:DUF4143 domain-containing protein [Kiritimatiellia bacterium]
MRDLRHSSFSTILHFPFSTLHSPGFIFESMCCRDLRIYSQPLDAQVSHFRDRNGLEMDLVVSLPDGASRQGRIAVGRRDQLRQ